MKNKKYLTNNLYCPICESVLFITHKEHYEDLSDHVCNPNEQPSLKDGYQCVNENCLCNVFDCSWIEDGEIFIDSDKLPKNIGWLKAHDLIKKLSKYKNYYAINSFNFYYELGKKEIKKYSFTINLKYLKIKFEPKNKGYKYEMDESYLPNLFSWKVEYWLFQKGGGYRHLIPFTTMFMFSVNQFNDKVSRLKEISEPLKNKNEIKDCVQYINGLSPWGQKEKRFFAKAATWFIKTFYTKKCEFIMDLYKQL